MSDKKDGPWAILEKQKDDATEMKQNAKTNAEIAEALGITENYVRQLLPPDIRD